MTYASRTSGEIAGQQRPTFGICLASPADGPCAWRKTYKLSSAIAGGNHPVKQARDRAVEITSQITARRRSDSLPSNIKVTHLNLYDGTVEGLRHTDKPMFSVQYHPRRSRGPHDADYLFQEFLDEMEKA